MRVALVGCSKTKQSFPCEAKNMYLLSSLFSKTRAYIEQSGFDKWFILSAKYGLLEPGTIIEPYDLTLNKMKDLELREWARRVWNQLKQVPISSVDFYCGERYRRYLVEFLRSGNIAFSIPLEGLSFGRQLQFYNKKISGRTRKLKGLF